MVAAGKGRMSEVSTLLTLGADPSVPSKDGSTAAQWARKMNQPQIADVIESHSQVRLDAMGALAARGPNTGMQRLQVICERVAHVHVSLHLSICWHMPSEICSSLA